MCCCLFLKEAWQAWVFKVSLLTAVSTVPILAQGKLSFTVPGITCMAGTQYPLAGDVVQTRSGCHGRSHPGAWAGYHASNVRLSSGFGARLDEARDEARQFFPSSEPARMVCGYSRSRGLPMSPRTETSRQTSPQGPHSCLLQ